MVKYILWTIVYVIRVSGQGQVPMSPDERRFPVHFNMQERRVLSETYHVSGGVGGRDVWNEVECEKGGEREE